MTLPALTFPLTILHKPDSASYQKWGGPEGVEAAAAAGATAIDVDAQESSTGEFMALHWANPGTHGFDAPKHPALMKKRSSAMTPAELGFFVSVAKDSVGYRIHTVREVMETAAPLGVTLCVEVKSMGDFAKLRRDAEETGCRVIVMTLPHLGGRNVGYKRLAAAKKAGLPTMVLLNETRFAAGQVPADQWQHVDFVKGPAKWRKGKPARVIALGAGSKHGITVSPSNARAVTTRLAKNWPSKPVTPKPTTPPVVTPPVVVKPPTAPPANSVTHLTAIAKKYVGFREGSNNDNPFAGRAGFANHQAWCASFVCAVFKEAGLFSLITTPSPGVDQLAVGFKQAKRWSEYPALGAVVCYGKPSDLNHTGIVIAYDADTITTVEGNTNDNGGREGTGVFLKKRLRRSTNVIGYGYPRFPEGITSADPAWARTAPVTTTPPVPAAPAPTAPVTLPPGGFSPRIDGIDISHWQGGKLDFAAAKAAGVKFVYHKATEHLSMKDKLYVPRRRQVGLVDIPFGAYHFARPAKSGGAAQAKFFLKVAAPEPGDLRPCLDLEDTGGLSMAQLQRWVEDFVAEVRRQTGKPPVLYTNFNLPRDPGCYLWRARYNNDNRQPAPIDAWVRWSMWQFSNGVLGKPNSVPGIGHCDINVLFPGFDINKILL